MIEAISRSELLGPLVLDELHKKGHSRFPVIDKDLDDIVGVLKMRDVLTLDTTRKHTSKVETAMKTEVFYIHEDQTLAHALNAFITTHHHLFIVVNEFRETVGILTLEDVIEALIGHEIVDEYDAHDDPRAVAKRSPRANRLDDAKDYRTTYNRLLNVLDSVFTDSHDMFLAEAGKRFFFEPIALDVTGDVFRTKQAR